MRAHRDPLHSEPESPDTAGSQTSQGEQLVDQQLRQVFRELARPQLSPFFESQLRQQLEQQRRQRLMRRCSRVMAVYWLSVALLSAGILLLLPWSTLTASSTLQAALLLVLATGVAPVWLLLRVLRADLIDTIAGTFNSWGSSWTHGEP